MTNKTTPATVEVTDAEVESALLNINSDGSRVNMRHALETFAQSRQASAQGGERVEQLSDEDIIAFARIASSENHYTGGRCVRMEFTPSNIVQFARSLATPPATSGPDALQGVADLSHELDLEFSPSPDTSGMKEAEALRDLLDLVVLPNRMRIGAEHGSPADLAITNAKKLAEGATPACYRPQIATPPNAPQDSLVGDAERFVFVIAAMLNPNSPEASAMVAGKVPDSIEQVRSIVDAAIRAGRKG